MPFPTPLLSPGFTLFLILHLLLSAAQGDEEWRLELIHENISAAASSSQSPPAPTWILPRGSSSSATDCSSSSPFHSVTSPANKTPPAWSPVSTGLQVQPGAFSSMDFPWDHNLLWAFTCSTVGRLQVDLCPTMGLRGLGSGGTTASPWSSPPTAGGSLLWCPEYFLLLFLHYKFIHIEAMIWPISHLISNEISCPQELPDKVLINDKQGSLCKGFADLWSPFHNSPI